MTAQCESLRDDLKAYVDNELSWPNRLRVGRHLRGCASCREEVGAMQKITEEVRASESDVRVLDAGLRDKILAGVGTHVPDQNAGRPVSKPRFTMAELLVAAGLIGILAAILFPVFSRSRENARLSSDHSSNVQRDMPFPPSAAPPIADAPSLSGSPRMGELNTRSPVQQNGLEREQAKAAMPQPGAIEDLQLPAGSATAGSAATGGSVDTELSLQRRVHKTASITVQVGDLESNTAAVEQMTKNVGGYIANNNLETGGDGLRRSMLTIKVPVAQFETVVDKIGKLGLIQSKQVSGEDITARVSDAEQAKTVLANQLAQQVERLKRAKDQDKPLQRHEARLIQIQLAQARARYNMLNKLATLSTITVQLQEKPGATPTPASGFMDGLNETKHAATEAFMSALRIPLMILMWILAYSPLWIPLLLIYRFASRTYLRRTP